jgi:CheY-like chemotaxis protein
VTPRCTGERVLLVDDSVDEREMYAEYLRTRGYRTLQAVTANDGYQIAAELSPAVVVTAVKLRGTEDGLGLTARLKADASTRDASVIVLTGFVFDTDREAAARAGCDRFLMKPCLPSALASAIDELIDRRARGTDAQRRYPRG